MYTELITFPEVFVRNVEFSFELLSTSSGVTNGSLVVEGERAVWQSNISSIAGPRANLSLTVELNEVHLNITDVEIVYIG